MSEQNNPDNLEIKEKQDLLEKLNNCSSELEKLKNQFLFVNADFQNYKKRVEKEKNEWNLLGQIAIINSFLNFIEDFSRAIESYENKELTEDNKKILEGFNIIYKNLNKILLDLQITQVDCNIDFNPEYHEAILQEDLPDHKHGQIVKVFSKGYKFKDKVLKHAKVSVAK